MKHHGITWSPLFIVAALYNTAKTHYCKERIYYLKTADSVTQTLNELSAPHHGASQVLRLSLRPSSSASPSENIVPSIYTFKICLCLI